MEFKTAQKPMMYGLSSPIPGDFGQGKAGGLPPVSMQPYTPAPTNYPTPDVFQSSNLGAASLSNNWTPSAFPPQIPPFQQTNYAPTFNPLLSPTQSPMPSSQFYPNPSPNEGWPLQQAQTAANGFSNPGSMNGFTPPAFNPGLNTAYGQPSMDEYRPARSQARPPARLSPAEQTVKKLEQPLIRFLDENPQIREKIDAINIDDVTKDVTGVVGNYRVSMHNAYNQVPRFVDRSIIKQLDPPMQGYAQEFFEWVRKPPTAQELAKARTLPGQRGNSNSAKKLFEEPVEKKSWNPFKRKPKAEPDFNPADLEMLLSGLNSGRF